MTRHKNGRTRSAYWVSVMVSACALLAPVHAVSNEAEAAPSSDAGTAAEIAQGETLYFDNCAGCHSEDGTGGVGPNLVASDYVANDEAVIGQILYGGGFMPPYMDTFTDEEIAAIVNYIRHTWNPGTLPVTPDAVAEVRP